MWQRVWFTISRSCHIYSWNSFTAGLGNSSNLLGQSRVKWFGALQIQHPSDSGYWHLFLKASHLSFLQFSDQLFEFGSEFLLSERASWNWAILALVWLGFFHASFFGRRLSISTSLLIIWDYRRFLQSIWEAALASSNQSAFRKAMTMDGIPISGVI